MTDMDWRMYANIAVWIGLGAYLAFLLRNQIALNRRLTQLETLDAGRRAVRAADAHKRGHGRSHAAGRHGPDAETPEKPHGP